MSDLVGVSGALKDARAKENLAYDLTGNVRRFAIDIPVMGLGEVVTQVWFPASYTSKPVHSWGFELISNESIPVNGTPFATVMVRSWNTELVPESNIKLYIGCRVAIRTSSGAFVDELSLVKFGFSIFFEGPAITMPGEY